jgi:hypothetical protein
VKRVTAGREVLPQFLVRLGFERIESPSSYRESHLWFRHPDRSLPTDRIVVLRSTSAGRTYQVDFGVGCKEARLLMRSRASRLPSEVLNRVISGDDLFFNLFSAGRALNWSLLAFPDVLGGTDKLVQLDELRDRVLSPFLDSIVDCAGVYNLLGDSRLPFEWSVSNPVIRAYEICAIKRLMGVGVGDTLKQLIEVQSSLEASYRSGSMWSQVLNSMVRALEL